MRALLPALALAVLSAHSAFAQQPAREVDLKPRTVTVGGGLIERTYFSDGEKNFAVTIDSETKVSAIDDGAIFRFTNIAQASMRLRKSPIKPLPFTPETLPEYLKAADKLIPAGAQGVAILSQEENVFPINQWKSYRFVFTYQAGGVGYLESFTFLFLDNGQQVLLQTGSPRKDFEVVAARADDIIRRWHEVLPGDEAGYN